MVSAWSYVISALALVVVGGSIGFTSYRLRRRLMPAWEGAPARLVESIVAIALLIWLGEILGTVGLFYAWALVGSALLLAVAARAFLSGGGAVGGPLRRQDPPARTPSPGWSPSASSPSSSRTGA